MKVSYNSSEMKQPPACMNKEKEAQVIKESIFVAAIGYKIFKKPVNNPS